jgi:hypothetical protein
MNERKISNEISYFNSKAERQVSKKTFGIILV